MEDNEIVKEAIQYFSSILAKDLNLKEEEQNVILNAIPSVISDAQNGNLVAIPKLEEIKEAIFALPAEKASNLDGFPTFFFQMYWVVIQYGLVRATQEFFGARNLLKEINATFLVLIPKVKGADSFETFRPMSLCNSFYKIFVKVLTKRFIKLFLEIIAPQ